MNSSTKFSHSNFLSTEVKEHMLKNISELLVHQYDYLLVTGNIGDITFHSALISLKKE